MAINTNSKAYQWLLDKWYTASEIQQMANAVNSWKTTQQAFDEVKSQRASAQSTPAQTTQKTNYQTITYNWQVSDNKGWTANMNSMSQTAAKANSRDFQVGTWDVVDMPQQPKVQSVATTTQSNNLAKAWQWLDYETQQKKLNSIAWLKDALAKKGITSKTAPTTTQTTTTPKRITQVQTPKQDQWDYQDNSQARMDQIANNLNGYRQTMPQLFDDMSAFYNFFIKDKGRSQDQIDFLWDYYERVQKYGKYDNMSPEQLWTWIANWEIPEDYLNTLKSTDPQKYQEVISAKQNREDTIKNESFLNDAAAMAWIEWWESEPSSIQYGKWNWIWMDEDSNGIDDRREHYATEEEQGYQKQIADLNAANLDIDNKVKHDYDDLVERYPWATKATLMAMAQDQNAKLLREKENNLVELTRLQGYVWYMQSERQEMNKAGADSIAQLQKNLQMYYDYSPQWIAELAQAKYAATNITLDQADSWNETQQQMAIEAAITPIYEQYADIIQRSPAEVINDVIAYAKKNWIWLRQALEENFMKPLREKPAYQSMQSQMNATWLKREKVGKDANWNDIYWFVDLANKTVSPYWAIWGWVSSATANTYTLEEVSSNRDKRVSAMRDIANQYDNLWDMADAIAYNMEGVGWGKLECWQYVNDYINAVTWSKWQYGNLVSQKAALAPNKDWNSIQVWDVLVFDYNKNTPQWVLNSPQKADLLKYWHVGFVTWINPDGSINMSHTNWWVVQNTVVKPWSSFYNSFAGSQHINKSQSLWKWFNEQLTNEYLAFIKAAWKPADQKKIAEWLWMSVDELREQSNKYSWQQTADTYFDMLGRINNILSLAESWDLPSFATRKNAQSEWFFWGLATRNQSVSDWKADNDKIVDTLSLDSLINLKWRWATFWALSDSEREAIGRYATALWSPMSDAKYINELKQLRAKLIESSHWYLWDVTSYWQNQSYMGNQSYDWTAWI